MIAELGPPPAAAHLGGRFGEGGPDCGVAPPSLRPLKEPPVPLAPLARRLVPPLIGSPASPRESRYAAMRSWSTGIGPPDCGTRNNQV